MQEEVVRCSCCGELVAANNIELVLRRPDEIAGMDEQEVVQRCKFNDDIYILDDNRFFLRCTIPLPVRGGTERYSIGAWAELTQDQFQKVWDLWEEEDLTTEPPMEAKLANTIPLTDHSLNCSVQIRLIGASTRPEIFIADTHCSLYEEQNSGIPAHRASEYSDLIRA
ncbi:DUF2199 domain-containing protein [Marinobacter sp. BW6]|uniref:DUF2199 domain-containing protein n=1 Tax=Marinobacter sp. BW6 TaxID=2592624 RepID=UPI0011DEDA23|nr:DUF2199 domain-containing protein [Marinobacter sp. BW6]TYC53227.1 DUF2199 domain-containing protein [Marinobacter sp. BW6]